MKKVHGINYIEKAIDWDNVKRADFVNVNGGYPTEKFPVIIRREGLSIVEDIIGEMPIVHDKGLSGEYNTLDKFLTEECQS